MIENKPKFNTIRTSISVLIGALALTVFLTSVVLEQGEKNYLERGVNSEVLTYPLVKSKGTLVTVTSGKNSSDDLIKQAKRFYDAGNKSGAVKICEAVLNKHPENAAALNLLADIYLLRDDYEKAGMYLDLFLKIHPNDMNARMRRGIVYLRNHNYEDAKTELDYVLKNKFNSGGVHLAYSCAVAGGGDKDLAMKHLQIAYSRMGFSLLTHLDMPELDILRNDVRFVALEQKAKSEYQQALANIAEEKKLQ